MPPSPSSPDMLAASKLSRGAASRVLPPLPFVKDYPEYLSGLQTIIGVGKNYSKHIDEMWEKYEKDLPKAKKQKTDPSHLHTGSNPISRTRQSRPSHDPILFQKPRTSLVFDSPIMYPKSCGPVHHEIELAVIIGKQAYHVREQDALQYVRGFTVGLDMTARDPQTAAKDNGHPWDVAKGRPHFLPLPRNYLTTAECLPNGSDAASGSLAGIL